MKRQYRQVERARQAEETGQRIVAAAIPLFRAQGYAGFTLAAVAEAAGVTQQTVIRRFGGKEGLLEACAEVATARIVGQRDEASPGDLARIVRNLVEHYEQDGDTALRLLADEHLSDQVARFAEQGRQYHRAWCERVFAPALHGLAPALRRRRLAQYVAVCDVHTWQLLRRQAGLTRGQAETALVELLEPLAEGSSA